MLVFAGIFRVFWYIFCFRSAMLKKIKNGVFGKCLRVVLIGYFLLNSINISASLDGIIANNTESHCLIGKTCHILKKLLKPDTLLEELEDYETSKTKTDKSTKGFQLADYLVPVYTALPCNYSINEGDKKTHNYNLVISPSFYTKIHLPPPEFIL